MADDFLHRDSSSDVFANGSLFIRPFKDYSKAIHAGAFVCRATNAAGSIQTLPIQLKPRKRRSLPHAQSHLFDNDHLCSLCCVLN